MNGAMLFNPDRFVTCVPAQETGPQRTVPGIQPKDNRDLPPEWQKGLDRLNVMEMPLAAEPTRWAQIVLDAHRLAWSWHRQALRLGWSVGALFGYDPTQPGVHSLVLDIRGGRVFAMQRDQRDRHVAAIALPDGGGRHHYRGYADNLPPIWLLRGGR